MTQSGNSTSGAEPGSVHGSPTAAARGKLSEAGEHLKAAAQLAGNTARSAAEVVGSELRSGGRAVGDELREARRSGRDAASQAREVADEQLQVALERGRGLLHDTEALIRSRPLAAVGVAVVAGILLSRLGRHG